MDKSCLLKPNKRPVAWSDIRLLLFDCDGVLTDCRIIYGEEDLELKHFHGHDGMGFNLLRYTDVQVGVITGRTSAALSRRCKDLHIEHLYQGVENKLKCMNELLVKLNLEPKNVCYMGDDWNDVPVMRKVAFSAAPADAQPDVIKVVDWISPRDGGHGAVRDLINYVLMRKGLLERAVMQYLETIC
ncbi:MAG: HAD-IIIA family hydrolase [Candidatus Cloacimonetes bacterium]|nr:HAD-IIIA family hydrolase [Candidatus Cloacimonadota bacterium]